MSDVWIFRGSKPVMWRIPIKVVLKKRSDIWPSARKKTKGEGSAHFEPAIRLLSCQRQALEAFYATHKKMQCVNGEWRMRGQYVLAGLRFENLMEKMGAIRATSDDPEEHLVWGPKPPPLGDLSSEQKERRAWLEDLLARGVGESVEQLAYYWREFRIHIAHTLINKEQPVDFQFFKLHNCPLRARWHEELFHNKINFAEESSEATEPRLLEFDVARKHCLRHIELEHGQEWWDLIAKTEFTRLQRMGHENYAEEIKKSVERFTPLAWRLHKTWLEEMAYSDLVCPEGGLGSLDRSVSWALERQMYLQNARYRSIAEAAYWNSVKGRFCPARVNGSIAAALSRKNGRVSKVSNLRPKAQVVRQPSGDRPGPSVDKPGDGTGGSDGVLLCPPDGRVVSEEAVLASRAGSDDGGLAGGT